MKHRIKFGICLDNFSDDFVRKKATLEDLIKRIAKLGYQGIEFTPAQMLPSYPEISDQDIEQVRELLSKYHMEPFCWNIYLDLGAVSGRELSENEIHKAIMQNLIFAKRAGFSVIKTSRAITARIFQKMLPLCRDLDMKLAVELDETSTLSKECPTEEIEEFLSIIRKEGEGQEGVIAELEYLTLPTADKVDLMKLIFGINVRPELVLKNQDLITSVVQTGFSGYLLCKSGTKTSPKAFSLAEQFLKNCNFIMEQTNHEIED